MSEFDIEIVKIDNTYARIVTGNTGLMEALYRRFSVPVDNFWFMPAYKSGRWDGKIHFIEANGRFYVGLFKKVYNFLKDEKDIVITVDPDLQTQVLDQEALKKDFDEVTEATMTNVIPYYYQTRGALKCVYHKRAMCEHTTGSGKSYTMLLAINYMLHRKLTDKILIVVPKLDLIEQLYENFVTFGFPEEKIGKYCGYQKDIDQPVIISTWQSCYKDAEFLRRFHTLIVDECFSGDSLVTMADNSKKKIKDINKNDMVLTYNESSGKIEPNKVIELHKNLKKSNSATFYELIFDNGTTVHVTGNHKFNTKNRGWVCAEDLNEFDELICLP